MLRKSSSIAVLLMRKSLVERKRRSKFQHLGELTYALCKTNIIIDRAKEIDSLNKEINNYKVQIKGLKDSKIPLKEEKNSKQSFDFTWIILLLTIIFLIDRFVEKRLVKR
jgi:hypothetical protein